MTINKRLDYIENWDLKIKKKADKEKNLPKINWEIENEYEQIITKYIHDNFSFVTIPNLINETERLRLEKGLIATFAQGTERVSSTNWIGNKHPDNKIRKHKLWNIHHLLGSPLTELEINKIENELK